MSSSQPIVQGDTPMNRQTVSEMTIANIDTHLNGVRERRLETVRQFEKDQQNAIQLQVDKINARLQKHFEMFKKEETSCMKAIEKLEKRGAQIQAGIMEQQLISGGARI